MAVGESGYGSVRLSENTRITIICGKGRLIEGPERSNHNPRVGGSSPSPATNYFNGLE